MLRVIPHPSRFMTALFTLVIATPFALRAQAQDANGNAQTPYLDDWTHHHVVFSNPGTRDDAEKNGKLDQWNRINNDPRYQIQKGKREHGNRQVPDGPGDVAWGNSHDHHGHHDGGNPPPNPLAIEKDWSQPLGSGTAGVKTVTIATPSGTTVSGSSQFTLGGVTFSASAPVAASQTGTFTAEPTNAQIVNIVNGVNNLQLKIGAPSSTTIAVVTNPGSGVTVSTGTGGYTYQFEVNTFNCSAGDRCVQIAFGGTNPQYTTATNLAGAIAGTCANTCPGGNGTLDPNVVVFSNSGTGTLTIYNATASSVMLATNNTTDIHINGAANSNYTFAAPAGSNGCTLATLGTFINPDNPTNLATALAAAIASCNTSFSAVGVTATSSGAVVTVKAAAPGSSGNSITLTSALTGFTAWSSTALSGGSDGTPSTTAFTYWSGATYISTQQLAANIAALVNSNPTTGPAISASSAPTTVTFTNAGSASAFPVTITSFTALNNALGNFSVPAETALPATIQPNVYPAKWGASLTAADCTNDFVVYPTGQAGGPAGAGAANIIAYNNLYNNSTCTALGTVPSVLWAFNTGTGYTVTTSPIISQDGSEVIFVQSNGTQAQLVVLKPAAGGTLASSNTSLTNGASNISACTAPCAVETTFASNHDDTYSSPFYDFASDDAVFVGDDSGNLQKIPGALHSVAQPVATAVALTGAGPLASPVYDNTSGCVFVGDTTNGYLYRVYSGTIGTQCTTATFGTTNFRSVLQGNGTAGDGIYDAPLLDPTSGNVFAFVTASKAITATGTCAAGTNCVDQFATSFAAATNPARVEPVGAGAANFNLYSGNFDNVYYSSLTSTGNLYVVGNTNSLLGANLYRITMTTGNMAGVATAVTGLNTTTYPWPSPVTEFCDNGTSACATTTGGACGTGVTCTTSGNDYIFFSVSSGAASISSTTTGCTPGAGNGCIFSYNVNTTTPALPSANSALNVTGTAGPNGCWATGGFVIDNSATGTTGAAQIYFINLNGAEAGGPNGNSSANCSAGTSPIIQGVQASQSLP